MSSVISFEIFVTDIQRAINFYSKTFGLEIGKVHESTSKQTKVAFFLSEQDQKGIGGTLVEDQAYLALLKTRHMNGIILHFHSNDIQLTLKKVIDNGGTIIFDNISYARVQDSEGNQIGIRTVD